MRLAKFKIENFRSIKSAEIDMTSQNLIVLVGKNNVGKTNVINALNIAMSEFTGINNKRYLGYSRESNLCYSWDRDYPVNLCAEDIDCSTTFRIELLVSAGKEQLELEKSTGLHSNKFEIILQYLQGQTRPKLSVVARGKKLAAKSCNKLVNFIHSHLFFNYIKAVRTENDINEELNKAIRNALFTLRNNEKFIEAQEVANKIFNTELEKISKKLLIPLKPFLPNLRSIKLSPNRSNGILTNQPFIHKLTLRLMMVA